MMDRARWIAPAGVAPDTELTFRARREFVVEGRPSWTELRIACESCYLLELNGRVVCRGPARGSHNIHYFDRMDVAPWLQEGLNRVSVLVRYTKKADLFTNCVQPALWMELGDFLHTDGDWQCEICNREWPENTCWFSQQSGYCEWHDLRFLNEGERVATEVLPSTSPVCRKRLLPRDVPMPEEHRYPAVDIPVACLVPEHDGRREGIAELNTNEPHLPMPEGLRQALYQLTLGGVHAVEIPPCPGGVALIFDFGREISGRVEIEITAPEGTVADLGYEEMLWNGDRLRTDHTHTNPTYQFCDRLILREGRNVVGTCLMDRGFRLVQLTLRDFERPVVLNKISAVDRRYPLSERADFQCGDHFLNRLWEMSRETLSACVTDVFTDCPWRERLFYINDLLVENRTALCCFGDWRLTRHALELAFDEQGDDDLITSSCPSERRSPFAVILSANLTLALVLYDYWLYSGDKECVRRHYPALKRIMARFKLWLGADGVLVPPADYWNFFDWSYESNGTIFTGHISSLLNCLYLLALRTMRLLAPVAGEECNEAEEALERLADQTRKAFWNPELGCLVDGYDCDASPQVLKALGIPEAPRREQAVSRLPHAFALLAGMAPASDYLPSVLDEGLLTPDFYYLFFLLEAMVSCGRPRDALECIRHYWADVVVSGSPTIWEAGVHSPGKAAFGGSASLCHGFSTAPAAFLQRVVLGVIPLEAGFRRFRFEPQLPELCFAKGRVPTPHGAIHASWHWDNGEIQAELTVPPECMAATPAGEFQSGTHQFHWRSTDGSSVHSIK